MKDVWLLVILSIRAHTCPTHALEWLDGLLPWRGPIISFCFAQNAWCSAHVGACMLGSFHQLIQYNTIGTGILCRLSCVLRIPVSAFMCYEERGYTDGYVPLLFTGTVLVLY